LWLAGTPPPNASANGASLWPAGTPPAPNASADDASLWPAGGDAGPSSKGRVIKFLFQTTVQTTAMIFSKEYVGYLAREVTKRLIASEMIDTQNVPVVTEKVHAALFDEMSLEDRINDEVRNILEVYGDEMRKSGANYQEMFKKVKMELVRKYKAVL
jgi:hypothetical protein